MWIIIIIAIGLPLLHFLKDRQDIKERQHEELLEKMEEMRKYPGLTDEEIAYEKEREMDNEMWEIAHGKSKR